MASPRSSRSPRTVEPLPAPRRGGNRFRQRTPDSTLIAIKAVGVGSALPGVDLGAGPVCAVWASLYGVGRCARRVQGRRGLGRKPLTVDGDATIGQGPYPPADCHNHGNGNTNTRACTAFSPGRNQPLPCHGSLTRRSSSIRRRPRPPVRIKPPGWEIRGRNPDVTARSVHAQDVQGKTRRRQGGEVRRARGLSVPPDGQ